MTQGHRRGRRGIQASGSRLLWIPACAALIAAFAIRARAQVPESKAGALPETRTGDLTEVPLEDLMNMEISSVSKKTERLLDAPAAVTVITQEDIRRSGARSIPEALRMVPGLDVARISANQWAISARGFNDRFANKMLVLIDGRTVYNPLFSGVYWEVQDLPLEDIERIEVIRGPGATLWGANAVNGVINIITKSAEETEGGLVTGGMGTEERAFGTVRYGVKLSENLFVRLWFKMFDRDDSVGPFGADAHDAWSIARGGFRFDWKPGDEDRVTFQGDAYDGALGQTDPTPVFVPPFTAEIPSTADVSGWDLLARWTRTLSAQSSFSLQLYADEAERLDPHFIDEKEDTFDLDFQHRFPVGDWNDFVWGAGYRYIEDHTKDTAGAAVDPASRQYQVFSLFVQDTMTLVKDALRCTIGTKLEHNDFSGFEVQPSIRLAWTIDPSNTVWGSVSRAVRTPARLDQDVRATFQILPGPMGLPIIATALGNKDVGSEELLAYEVGYRTEPVDRLFLDAALFYNDYEHLRSLEIGVPAFEPAPFPHLLLPSTFANNLKGEVYGVELTAEWKPFDCWRLASTYSLLEIQIHRRGGSNDTTNEMTIEGSSPEQQFGFRSYLDVTKDVEFDVLAYYVDRLPAQGVRGYLRLDLRLGWRPCKNAEVSIGVQNLLDDHHPEFGQEQIGRFPTEVERMVYGQVTFTF